MKNTNILSLSIFLIALLANSSFANGNDNNRIITPNAIQNLKAGLQSENIGLKKHCIYFAGKYKLNQVYDELKEQYKKENNISLKRLILVSMYEIKNENSERDFYKLAISEKNKKLKSIAAAAYLQLNISDSLKYYSKLNK
ncbi:MAG: hypothetical protein PVH88_11920 [Ignavibacteria bacterium]|jgi:hypothetical protein